MKIFSGLVTSGRGEAGAFTQLSWLRARFRDRFGFDPYPGTLNVRLDEPLKGNALADLDWVAIDAEEAGYCAARALRVEIDGRTSAVWIVPQVAGYPNDQIELMAEQSLRVLLGLEDGDRIMIRVEEGEG